MSGNCLTIAVVDDEAPVRKALARLLRAAGFGVGTFASGDEFLNSLETRLPDCAILDLHLPGPSGLDIQQRISARSIPVPCIVITGKDEPGTKERALAMGAAAYLRKPLDEQPLLAAIRGAIPEHLTVENAENKKCAATGDSVNQATVEDGGSI